MQRGQRPPLIKLQALGIMKNRAGTHSKKNGCQRGVPAKGNTDDVWRKVFRWSRPRDFTLPSAALNTFSIAVPGRVTKDNFSDSVI
jgi:hypothetical protein